MLLAQITEGRNQLPDFQRGWVWDDDHVRSLLISIAWEFFESQQHDDG